MDIRLTEVKEEELKTLWQMQTEAFAELLERYRDYDMSPGNEEPKSVVSVRQQ